MSVARAASIGRTSQEVRGLKPQARRQPRTGRSRTSQEVRGLKLICCVRSSPPAMSHLARGAWIETNLSNRFIRKIGCRTSQEVRGLKRNTYLSTLVVRRSHLARGAWIETMTPKQDYYYSSESHLARGAWIETCPVKASKFCSVVAPRKRCVD